MFRRNIETYSISDKDIPEHKFVKLRPIKMRKALSPVLYQPLKQSTNKPNQDTKEIRNTKSW